MFHNKFVYNLYEMPNAYEILNVPADCEDDRTIKLAYHKLA